MSLRPITRIIKSKPRLEGSGARSRLTGTFQQRYHCNMANLNIRKVPESVRRGLRLRAARKGRSMEAEARTILSAAVRRETGKPFDPEALQDFISGLFKRRPPRLTDELLRERRREAAEEKRE